MASNSVEGPPGYQEALSSGPEAPCAIASTGSHNTRHAADRGRDGPVPRRHKKKRQLPEPLTTEGSQSWQSATLAMGASSRKADHVVWSKRAGGGSSDSDNASSSSPSSSSSSSSGGPASRRAASDNEAQLGHSNDLSAHHLYWRSSGQAFAVQSRSGGRASRRTRSVPSRCIARASNGRGFGDTDSGADDCYISDYMSDSKKKRHATSKRRALWEASSPRKSSLRTEAIRRLSEVDGFRPASRLPPFDDAGTYDDTGLGQSSRLASLLRGRSPVTLGSDDVASHLPEFQAGHRKMWPQGKHKAAAQERARRQPQEAGHRVWVTSASEQEDRASEQDSRVALRRDQASKDFVGHRFSGTASSSCATAEANERGDGSAEATMGNTETSPQHPPAGLDDDKQGHTTWESEDSSRSPRHATPKDANELKANVKRGASSQGHLDGTEGAAASEGPDDDGAMNPHTVWTSEEDGECIQDVEARLKRDRRDQQEKRPDRVEPEKDEEHKVWDSSGSSNEAA